MYEILIHLPPVNEAQWPTFKNLSRIILVPCLCLSATVYTESNTGVEKILWRRGSETLFILKMKLFSTTRKKVLICW